MGAKGGAVSSPSTEVLDAPESSPDVSADVALQQQKNLEAVALLESWLADESGEDERVWPELKAGLEQHHPSSRKLFSD